jgi:hypothetical protein
MQYISFWSVLGENTNAVKKSTEAILNFSCERTSIESKVGMYVHLFSPEFRTKS